MITWLIAHQPVLAALALAASLATNTGQAVITWIGVGQKVEQVVKEHKAAPVEAHQPQEH